MISANVAIHVLDRKIERETVGPVSADDGGNWDARRLEEVVASARLDDFAVAVNVATYRISKSDNSTWSFIFLFSFLFRSRYTWQSTIEHSQQLIGSIKGCRSSEMDRTFGIRGSYDVSEFAAGKLVRLRASSTANFLMRPAASLVT